MLVNSTIADSRKQYLNFRKCAIFFRKNTLPGKTAYGIMENHEDA